MMVAAPSDRVNGHRDYAWTPARRSRGGAVDFQARKRGRLANALDSGCRAVAFRVEPICTVLRAAGTQIAPGSDYAWQNPTALIALADARHLEVLRREHAQN